MSVMKVAVLVLWIQPTKHLQQSFGDGKDIIFGKKDLNQSNIDNIVALDKVFWKIFEDVVLAKFDVWWSA